MSSFYDQLCGPGFPLSLEITPPKTSNPVILQRRAALLRDRSRTVNVIQRPDRQSSLEASLELAAADLEPVWHLAVRGNTLESITADARRAVTGGVTHALCLLGDHAPDPSVESPTISAAIRGIAEATPGMVIGATANQYVLDEKAWKNLDGKIRAGARFIQTQPVFEAAAIVPFAEQLKAKYPGVQLVPMVMPLTTAAAAESIHNRLKIDLPRPLAGYLEVGDAEAAWGMFAETAGALRDSPLFAGVAVMTFEMDAHIETGQRICDALG